jgi:hypothetical protein
MPYVLLKSAEIADGVLQLLDLKPNTSQRNPSATYEANPQSKYVRAVQRQTPKLLDNGGTITFGGVAPTVGLEAWFLTNVNDGTGAVATGSITTVAEASLVDGETFTLDDGTTSVTFEFDLAGGDGVAGGNVAVVLGGAATADDVRDAIILAITGSALGITAADGGAATVDLTNDTVGTVGNTTSAETVANGTFAVTDMTGGADADSLTAAEAVQDADDVLDLYKYGDSAAAGALTLAAVNGALTTGEITSDQLPELLDILAGRGYQVPAGTQIETGSAFIVSPAVGAEGGPGFVEGSLRDLYSTGSLKLSVGLGRLSKRITAGQVAVYNDDGSLF